MKTTTDEFNRVFSGSPKSYPDGVSSASWDYLGIAPDEMIGYTLDEIREFVESVQQGVQGERLTAEEVNEAAEKIFRDTELIAEDDN